MFKKFENIFQKHIKLIMTRKINISLDWIHLNKIIISIVEVKIIDFIPRLSIDNNS